VEMRPKKTIKILVLVMLFLGVLTFLDSHKEGTELLNLRQTESKLPFASLEAQTQVSLDEDAWKLELLGQLTGFAATGIGLYVESNYAYVAAGDQGLEILDVSNTSSPQKTVQYTERTAYDFVVEDGKAYVACSSSGGFSILNVSAVPNGIVTEISYSLSGSVVSSVAVADSYLYVVDRSASCVRMFDVSDPYNPAEVLNLGDGGDPQMIVTNGSYAYVWDRIHGLEVYDISNSSNPYKVIQTEDGGEGENVMISGSYAYVAREAYGLDIIDLSNPAAPAEVGRYGGNSGTFPLHAFNVFVEGKFAFVTCDYGLIIIDVSDPAHLRSVGKLEQQTYIARPYVKDKVVFLADSTGLRIFQMEINRPPLGPPFQTPYGSVIIVVATLLAAGGVCRGFGRRSREKGQ
jgi:hypothetical protein